MSAISLQFSTQAQLDLGRMTQQMTDLNRQVSSLVKSNDLAGFGGGAARLVSAQGLKASADARASTVNQLVARFGVQSAALNQVSTSTQSMAQSINDALSSNDGRGIATDLNLQFSSIVQALNETWNGQPLFSGEKLSGNPVKITTIDQLQAATSPSDIFDEAARHQVLDLGAGSPISLADKASEMSQPLFNTLRSLADLVSGAGGQLGTPLTDDQRAQLTTLSAQLGAQANSFTAEEGRSGQLQNRFEAEYTRLSNRSDLMTKEIGDQADADIAAVSVQLNTLTVQYQASAKTFADLSKLSLLNYLT